MFIVYIFSVSHKIIGISYFIFSIISGFLGFTYSILIRIELLTIGVNVLFGDYQYYNCIITAHGLVMIFAFIMPVILGGFVNYWLPVLLGIPDMIFPRINNLSFWLYLLGVIFMILGVAIEEGIGLGWTLYPTLICIDFHSSISVDYSIFAVHVFGISSILNSLNIVGTIFCIRRRYVFIVFLNLFIWSIILVSLILIVVLPVLAAAVTLVLFDRNFNSVFYDILGGGDLLLFQHLFWFFGHPEVYIIIIPVFGFVSLLLDTLCIRFVFSILSGIYSMCSISILGFFVWAHHMFVVGMDVDSRAYFGSITFIIGVPTCIKIYNWLFTIFISDSIYCIELAYVMLFTFMFLFGGITGLLLANVGLDILLHDTYFVVTHFHYVLSLGAVIGVIGAFIHFLYRWIPVEYNIYIMYYLYYLIFLGSNLVFFPLHSLGLYSFPRRISDYPLCYLSLSYLISIGLLYLICFVLTLSNLFCFSNIALFYFFTYYLYFFSDNTYFSFYISIFNLTIYYGDFNNFLYVCVLLYCLLYDFLHLLIFDCFIILINTSSHSNILLIH